MIRTFTFRSGATIQNPSKDFIQDDSGNIEFPQDEGETITGRIDYTFSFPEEERQFLDDFVAGFRFKRPIATAFLNNILA